MFVDQVTMAVHEAPVYVPGINKLFVGVLEQGYLPQLFVDLNRDPPTLSEFESDPPVYAPDGGYHGGLVHWGAGGGNNSIGGTEQRPGVRVLDPTTNKTTTLLNNYFGFHFNGLDDLFVDSHGDIWFTDPDYAWNGNRTDTTPQLHAQTYHPLGQPNGIAISPDAENVYFWDTIAGGGTISPHYPNVHSMPYNQTAKHTVYKYDIVDADTAPALINKRPFYYSQEWVPDGVNVAANGFVVAGVGMGVDVIDRTSSLVLQIRTHYIVQNFALGGRGSYGILVGWVRGGISRVRWNSEGGRS
ncbi:hypothetical protein D6D22_07520 [Aureobasidium pullulans]|uniref:SMP-30/Gluconolactonase/LRE-like region domain-containing protein n=1 Tax=Aureobasidium pullulans TaxID=5580 RepID=A0A4S8XH53_AURPU|nr:hypothetical protein D6D22_07520 [Aureobasidium pullulans]